MVKDHGTGQILGKGIVDRRVRYAEIALLAPLTHNQTLELKSHDGYSQVTKVGSSLPMVAFAGNPYRVDEKGNYTLTGMGFSADTLVEARIGPSNSFVTWNSAAIGSDRLLIRVPTIVPAGGLAVDVMLRISKPGMTTPLFRPLWVREKP